ncbi:uncharacterized protein LOC117608717 isoform X1 [Osmia lignaria lignaria]|uniref:uncharacterized protein LOC117608717 isoform X1 n=1 Tax=Osmia lignaria lignaria TaxID=1437193 RepID=UPI0014792808|nr:uncharacterized protein LOC117608717 isoform X1 [Osmia lignaria]
MIVCRVRGTSEHIAATSSHVHLSSVAILAITCCCLVMFTKAEDDSSLSEQSQSTLLNYDAGEIRGSDEGDATAPLNRQKRTLFLKKKLIGAGLLGFGLGIAKGYKAGYYSAPEVRHVYLSPPPASTKYVEYVEKPVYIERIIERPAPVYKPVHVEYRESSPYGSW